MSDDKRKGATFWLKPETIQKMDALMAKANCQSRSELADKAIQFYLGYLECDDASKYLPEAVSTVMKGILENNNDRLRSLLFKWAVELNMACHTIAAYFRVDDIDRNALRKFAVDEVKKTCGKVSFDHALDVQRRIPVKDDTKWPG